MQYIHLNHFNIDSRGIQRIMIVEVSRLSFLCYG
jgi:hypothetical protein